MMSPDTLPFPHRPLAAPSHMIAVMKPPSGFLPNKTVAFCISEMQDFRLSTSGRSHAIVYSRHTTNKQRAYPLNEPHVITILISIAGAAALLIWAVRLVRTGVERGFAAPMRIWLRHSAKNRLLAAGTGMGAAILLQSSTAVAVLVSNFVTKGGLAGAAGLAILLGADGGSAIVTQLLVVRQPILIPLLLLIGVECQL